MKSAAVLYVKDLSRMRAFYRTCFQMEVVDDARDYCVLESESLTLSLVAVPERIAATIAVSTPPARREGVPIKLAFAVDSIDALRPIFVELGGVADPPTSQWTSRGGVHCDGVDPEGNVVQLVEPTAQPDRRKESWGLGSTLLEADPPPTPSPVVAPAPMSNPRTVQD